MMRGLSGSLLFLLSTCDANACCVCLRAGGNVVDHVHQVPQGVQQEGVVTPITPGPAGNEGLGFVGGVQTP
jgi:hypothetical protein